MTKIFQTFGTGWYFWSGETPLVTTAFVVVVGPAAGDFLFFLNFFPRTKNTMARIMPRIHKATKPASIIFFVDQPKIINKYKYIISSNKKPCDGNDPVLLKSNSL